jgi:hypothetical protein
MNNTKLTPSLKGQLTKALTTSRTPQEVFNKVRAVFSKIMPREQSGHATHKYLCCRLADFRRQ